MKTKLHIVLILTLSLVGLILLQVLSLAATYYVSPTGAGNYDGSSAANAFSLSQAQSFATTRTDEGLTFLLAGGDYGAVYFNQTEIRTSWDRGVTYKAAPGETPVFTHLSITGSFDRYLEFDGIDVVNQVSTGGRLIYLRGSGHMHFKNMYICGNGADGLGQYEWTGYGIWTFYTHDSHTQRDLLIENCEITRVSAPIDLNYDCFRGGIVIRNNDIHYTASTGIAITGEKEDPVIIEGNHIHNQLSVGENHGSGISIRCRPVTIRNNIIHDYGRTSLLGFYWQKFDGGLWLINGTMVGNFIRWERVTQSETGFAGVVHLIQGNVLRVQRDPDQEEVLFQEGYDLVGQDSGAVLSNAVVATTGPYWGPEPVGGYKNTTIENNLLYDPRNIVYTLWGSGFGDNLVFRNNTFISRWYMKESAPNNYFRRYGDAAQFGSVRGTDVSTWRIYNNIFVGAVTLPGGGVGVPEDYNMIWALWYSDEVGPNSKLLTFGSPTSSSLAPGVSADYFENSEGFFIGGPDFDTYSYQYPQVGEAQTPHGVNLNDAYQLAPNSDAIGFAEPTQAPATDLLDNPRDAQPDCGCYEYGASSPSNQPPIANAGPDQTITDKDKDGGEEVTLDGSASRDPYGTIVSYVWSEGGLEIATGINPTVILSIGTYLITLTVTDNGGLTNTDTVTIKVLKGDKEFGELPTGCYNNVFNPTKGEEALIVVELPKQAQVKISLYNIRGNKIKELADEEKEPGTHKYYWDGENSNGDAVGSGLYFVHIQAGDYKKTKKIVVVK